MKEQRTALSRKRTSNSENNSRCKGEHTKSSSKSRKERTRVSHCFPRVLVFDNLSRILKKLCTAELRKILMYKEELLTDMKNLMYRHTDDVERLQKVIGDTEQQFVNCLQQIKTLGKKDERCQKELEDLRGAARSWWTLREPPRGWWTWWIHRKKVRQTHGPC
jgi:chromosome segregation ATPase